MVSPVRGTLPTTPPPRPVPGVPWAVARHEPSQLDRIEAKLDALLAALADEETEAPEIDLDGSALPGERDQDEEL